MQFINICEMDNDTEGWLELTNNKYSYFYNKDVPLIFYSTTSLNFMSCYKNSEFS